MSHYVEARLQAGCRPTETKPINPNYPSRAQVIVEAEIPKLVSGPFLESICYLNLFSLHFDLALLIT